MTRRAFVPAPLIDAQPRVYRSFRGRQLKGLLYGTGGAVLVIALVGIKDFTGYALAFLAALPGFAYGYFQPDGRPVEDWMKIIFRYHASPQRITNVSPRRTWNWRVLRAQFDPIINAAWRALRSDSLRKGRLPVGR
ncbi:MAG TPA: PrgI family protein [Symbiobacteriaceae bacterium]|nr:PrgI family protein [Symbiobacteriaceae bacterium]